MTVQVSERVETSLLSLGQDDRNRVRTWFDYFRRWDADPFIREHSLQLNLPGTPVYVFRASTDIRIFYSVDASQGIITVIDLATVDTIRRTGGAAVEAA